MMFPKNFRHLERILIKAAAIVISIDAGISIRVFIKRIFNHERDEIHEKAKEGRDLAR